jgi:recombinational DNA repair protein (RecF pathway)
MDSDAILLLVQPHREDDLFVLALARGHGVVGLHVPHGRKPGRRGAGLLQPFVMGRLHADTRGVLQGLEAADWMGASVLAREPRRFWVAHVLAEVLRPLAHGGPDLAPLFEEAWGLLAALHRPAPGFRAGGYLLAGLAALLRQAGVLPPHRACVVCGGALGGAGLAAFLVPETGFACARCAETEGHPWSPAELQALDGPIGEPGPALGPEGVSPGAVRALVEHAQAFLGREVVAFRGAEEWLQ